jgi:4-hydroxymandelate oxidase
VERWADTLEERAREVLPDAVHRYVRQGSRDGVTAGEASDGWNRIRFLPQVLRDVTKVDLSTTLLGTTLRSPIGIAPTTMQRALHPQGEVAMATAAAAAGAPMVVSSNAGSTFADIGATGVDWWLQMYLPSDRLSCRPLLKSAVDSGARAIVLTADTPVVATKYDGEGDTVWDLAEPGWPRVNFPEVRRPTAADEKATDLGPHDVDWLRQTTGLPVVVKGVLRPEDARRCVDAGAAAVWVSNHGGRQLDYAASTAACLPEVASLVGTHADVYVDGGLRNGRHVLAALAMGARAVFLGRPPLWALAVDGPAGVCRLLAELEQDLAESMRLVGCANVAALNPTLIA